MDWFLFKEEDVFLASAIHRTSCSLALQEEEVDELSKVLESLDEKHGNVESWVQSAMNVLMFKESS